MCEALVILGPTASGKSALALALSAHYRIEIISLDSALVYQGMDIGSAKPTKEELAICPHHLIDICDPAQSYSAANFRADCIRLVQEIRARGNLPVICGGTMMYYKALVDGLSPVPESTPEVRAQVQALADAHDWPYVHSLLKEIDPESYTRLDPKDKQRVARALGQPEGARSPIEGVAPFPVVENAGTYRVDPAKHDRYEPQHQQCPARLGGQGTHLE